MTNPANLLATLEPVLQPGTYAFCALPDGVDPTPLRPLATFREAEGLTVVVPVEMAEAHGLPVAFRAQWIALRLESALDGVGLTAAFSAVLAAAGIPCNVFAALHHDHILVPEGQGEAAVVALVGVGQRR